MLSQCVGRCKVIKMEAHCIHQSMQNNSPLLIIGKKKESEGRAVEVRAAEKISQH